MLLDGKFLFDVAAKEGAHVLRGLFVARSVIPPGKKGFKFVLYMFEETVSEKANDSAREAMMKALEGSHFFKGRIEQIGSPNAVTEVIDDNDQDAGSLASDKGNAAQMQFLPSKLMGSEFKIQFSIGTKDKPKIITVPYVGKPDAALFKTSINATLFRLIEGEKVIDKAMANLAKLGKKKTP